MRVRGITLCLSVLAGCYSGVGDFDGFGGGADGGNGVADAGDDAGDEDPSEGDFRVDPVPMRRLTRAQLVQSIRDLLALPQWEPESDLPDEGVNEEEFQLPNMVASTVTTTPVGYNRYRSVAKEAAALAFATDPDMVDRLGCTPTGPQDACVVDYLATACERAFGRAVPDDDPVLTALVDVVADGQAQLGSVREGLRWALVTLLQSPEFLYVYPVSDGQGGMDAYSKARRLALMLRDSIPDDALLAAARDGSLDDPEVFDAQVDRLIAQMLEDPQRRGAITRFFDEWWSLNLLPSLGKNAEAFPEFDEALRDSMQREVEQWLQDLVFERRQPFTSVLVSDRIYVDDALAQLYGIEGQFGDALEPVELSADSPRSGLLSTAAFLSLMAHPAITSPAARGRFVTERLLCLKIPPPPPNVDTTIPPPTQPETKRDRFVRHTTDPTCAGCHQMMDPMGLALEEFDAIGRYRREETVVFEGESYSLPLDTRGEFLGEPFDDSKQMAAVIADSPEFARCVTQQLLRHTLGRELSSEESAGVDQLEQHFVEQGLDFVELLRQVARHRIFTTFTEAE